ncbi:hypothetical protein WI372_08025 [Gemmatimonadota bacterium DH-20]|uniref:Uncharacterized protein n=1 Tax=Gaopeijia maritima TaxID=3119007 RepID=A0ABU9E8D5_9BACT
MTRLEWRRRPAEPAELGTAVGAALLLGAGTAAATFWVVRTLLARDRVSMRPEQLPPAPEPGRLP